MRLAQRVMDGKEALPPQSWSGAAGGLAVMAPLFAEGSGGAAAAPADTAWLLDDFAWDPVAMVRPARRRTRYALPDARFWCLGRRPTKRGHSFCATSASGAAAGPQRGDTAGRGAVAQRPRVLAPPAGVPCAGLRRCAVRQPQRAALLLPLPHLPDAPARGGSFDAGWAVAALPEVLQVARAFLLQRLKPHLHTPFVGADGAAATRRRRCRRCACQQQRN